MPEPTLSDPFISPPTPYHETYAIGRIAVVAQLAPHEQFTTESGVLVHAVLSDVMHDRRGLYTCHGTRDGAPVTVHTGTVPAPIRQLMAERATHEARCVLRGAEAWKATT